MYKCKQIQAKEYYTATKNNMAALFCLLLNNLKDIPLHEKKKIKNTVHSKAPFG